MGAAVHHIAFFRATTCRGSEIFQLKVQSDDVSLGRLLRAHLEDASNLEMVDANPKSVSSEDQIVIFDCRHGFPDFRDAGLLHKTCGQSNIALIDPTPENRRDAFLNGFADFLCWPLLAQELLACLLAQCRARALEDHRYRFSRVALVERSCAYMADHITQPVSARSLAQMFNTNHNTLNTAFKREMGLPPVAWQRKLRLERAARQLLLTDMPIGTVAANFGYDLPGNFTTAFQRHFGMTPNHYRKNESCKT